MNPTMADADHGQEAEAPPPPGKPVPWSETAEQSVLGSLLQDNAVMAEVADTLSASCFYAAAHRTIFETIESMLTDGDVADVITVHARLVDTGQADAAGGLVYLHTLSTCVASPRHIKRYAEIVADRAAERALIEGLDVAARIAWDSAVPFSDRMERITEVVRRVDHGRKNPGSKRVPMLQLEELQKSAQTVRWLCKRVIPADSIGMLFGGSGTFKSYIALDLALHICHGLPWMGRKTTKGPVIYIAAEGGAGLWARIAAWHRARGLDWRKAQLFVVPVAVDITQDAWRVVDAAQLLGVMPELVVVDTLSQTYSGEENSANEMAAYLRTVGTRFRALWHCAVLLVHHSGHSATDRPRGSSAIRANIDFLFGVHRDATEMIATVECQKQKDGELFDDASFKLLAIDIGTDEDGDVVRQLAAYHLSSADDVSEAMRSEAGAGRGGKNRMLLQLLQPGMKEKELRRWFMEQCSEMTDTAARQAYSRAINWARKHGFLEITGGLVFTLKSTD